MVWHVQLLVGDGHEWMTPGRVVAMEERAVAIPNPAGPWPRTAGRGNSR